MPWPTNFKIVDENFKYDSPWRMASADEVKPFEQALKQHLKDDQRVDFAGGRLRGIDIKNGVTFYIDGQETVPDYDGTDPVTDILIINEDAKPDQVEMDGPE